MTREFFLFKTIWLVDDDPDDIVILEDTIKKIIPNQFIEKFYSGELLLEALQTQDVPDLCFIDLSMPPVGGFECIIEIRGTAKTRHIPIVVYSSSPNERDIFKSYSLGANLYIKKPSSYNEIISTIDHVLRMDWSNPIKIRHRYFVDGKYIPFRAC